MSDRIRQGGYRDLFVILPLAAFFAALLILSFTDLVPGGCGEFIQAGGMVAPFVLLALFAWAGERVRWIQHIATLWLLCILLCLWAITLMVTMAPAVSLSDEEGALESWLDTLPAGTVGLTILVSLGAAVLPLVGFSRRFRVQLARLLPFDPDMYIHTVGLVCVLALIIMPVVPLLITGNAPFLDADLQAVLGIGSEEPGSSVRFDTFTLIWTVIASLFLVGLWVKRDLRSTLARLGLVRPTLRQVIFGVVSGILLAGVFWLVDDLLTALFLACGITITDETLVYNLFVASFTPLAAVVASVSAGLGEELSVRGVLQPRFGILLAALLFASLHAYQYAWDGVIGVFLAGLCFGIIRQYTNTSTSAISHAIYDLVLFGLVMAGITTI